ncbi:organic cation transporter protein-like isoform X1 [Watersipora subatra]|uniref:organic cation transporter protein-like isoform X1 n=2 Tax=Watersipora subatra TaxID=2589382 RepID=UPI00355AF4DA
MSSEERNQLLADESSTDEFSSISSQEHRTLTWEFDEAVCKVGFGRYQFILWFFLVLVAMSCGFNNMAMVFEGGNGGQICVIPQNRTSHDNSSLITYSAVDTCEYTKTTTNLANMSSHSQNFSCSHWIYNREVYNSTIVTEWDLTCNKEYLVDLASTIYMLGFFAGCIILGDVADRFGRRLMLLLSVLLSLGAGVGAAFSPVYVVFVILRFFVGFGVAGTRNSAYILAAEYGRPQDRATLGLISDMTYSCAYILTGLIFYLDPNWRHFQFYIGVYHVFYLTYFFFMPESPRWQLSKGKEKEALKYFRTSAIANGKHMPPAVTIVLPKQPPQSHSTLDLVRTPNMRKIGLVMALLWFIVSFVYFGMSYNVSNLEGSIYVNNAILGAVELVANGLCIFVVKFGRRPAIFTMFTIALAAMFAIIFAQGSYWAVIILAMIGKFIIAPCFSYIYIATIELYPTQTRTLALGAGSSLARLGGAVAPFIPSTVSYWDKLPYVIFSSVSLIGAIDALFLPETKNRPLPDSIERAEQVNIVKFHLPCDCSGPISVDPPLNEET